MRKTTRLRQLVTRPEIAFLMEAHSGLSARIAEEAGFEAILGDLAAFRPSLARRRGRPSGQGWSTAPAAG
jgi:2-methylisocitrate lyase-like PEP mutase family enzyme